MLSSSFFQNGSVLTMGDYKTYYCELSSENSIENKTEKASGHMGEIVCPEFSLHQIHKKWDILNLKQYTTENSMGLDLNLLDSLKNLKWVANFETYKNKYHQIQKLILNKEIQKAVPFMTYSADLPKDFNKKYLPIILEHLHANKPKPEYIYGFWSKTKGFIGSTPEFLIQKNELDSDIQTLALAGTLPSQDSRKMLDDDKLTQEHRFVMMDISEKLKDHKLDWTLPEEKVFGLVKHIYSSARFKMKPNQSLVQDLILSLSPTSALGVYPREKLNQLSQILSIETRGSYGAPFGYILKNQFNIVVALRGLFWDRKKMYIHVGGGVTDKSDLEIELKELQIKFLSTQKKLGLVTRSIS